MHTAIFPTIPDSVGQCPANGLARVAENLAACKLPAHPVKLLYQVFFKLPNRRRVFKIGDKQRRLLFVKLVDFLIIRSPGVFNRCDLKSHLSKLGQIVFVTLDHPLYGTIADLRLRCDHI